MPRNPGFLTETDREKLTGETDIEHPHQWKGRVRKSLAQAYQDMALLEESPHWGEEDSAKAFRNLQSNSPLNTNSQLPQQAIEAGMKSAETTAETYGSDVVSELPEMLRQIEENGEQFKQGLELEGKGDIDAVLEETRQFFVKQMVSLYIDAFETQGVANPEKIVREFFESLWPEEEEALEIVESELSES